MKMKQVFRMNGAYPSEASFAVAVIARRDSERHKSMSEF